MDADFYICGPGPFMDVVEETLLDEGGWAGSHRYRALRDGRRSGGRPPAEADPADVPESIVLILQGKKHRIEYHAGDTGPAGQCGHTFLL